MSNRDKDVEILMLAAISAKPRSLGAPHANMDESLGEP